MEQRGDKKEWLEKQCHWNNLCKQTQDLSRKKKIYHHLTFLCALFHLIFKIIHYYQRLIKEGVEIKILFFMTLGLKLIEVYDSKA